MATLGKTLYARRFTHTCDFLLEVLDNADSSGLPGELIVTIPVHGLILSACSPVFSAMIRSNMKEAESRVVRIDDSTPEAIETMVNFMYLERVKFTSISHCIHVCTAAHKYSVHGLGLKCEQYLMKQIHHERFRVRMKQCEFEGILNLVEVIEMEQLENMCFAFLFEFGKSLHNTWNLPEFLSVSQKDKFIVYQMDRTQPKALHHNARFPSLFNPQAIPVSSPQQLDPWYYKEQNDY